MPRVLFAAVIVLVSTACGGDDPPPLFLDLQWQLRCDIAGGCAGIPSHDVFGGDGTDGVALACSLSETVSGNQVLNFSAQSGTEFGLQVQNATFPAGGGPLVDSSCQVTVTENDNRYAGDCSAAVPTGPCTEDPKTSTGTCSQPCRFYDVNVASVADGIISARLFCKGLPLSADQTVVRELTNSDAAARGNEAENSPVTIKIEGCTLPSTT